MRLVSVNVALPREVRTDRGAVLTGIFKTPAAGRVAVRWTNLEGDAQADLDNHGGVHKAVYAYPVEHYEHWRREMGRGPFGHGQFGENLTVEGMLEDAVFIGDAFRIGTAVFEVSQPRTPCFKLGLRMGLPSFPKLFLESGRVGFYLRVLQEGEVGAGDAVEVAHRDPERLSVRETVRLMYFARADLEAARKALRVPALAPGWRRSFEERVAGR
jgi:MOSC domain-containing protein YiiM